MPRLSTRFWPSRMPGGIDELHRDAVERRGLRNQVARGAGDIGDDGAILFQQAVEQAALAHIGSADDRQRETFVHQVAVCEALRPVRRQPDATGASRRRISSAGATLISSSAKSMPASSSAISSSKLLLHRRDRRETEPAACCAAMRA